MISKEDFIQWKSEPVTKRIMELITEKIKSGMEELSYCAGSDPITDRERVGKLAAFRDVLGVSFYDLEDEDEH